MRRSNRLAVLLVALALRASAAAACSCSASAPRRVTVPDDGAVGFPTDGIVRVFATGFPPSLRALLAREYR
ncbi:MAG: hypothetical protein JWM10_5449, partial [Myxococcaceae bacterium]|nr:hypothetical protein [Myxococcaceae bacterium]